ncbi:MAG: glycogen synthase GlgA [Clostridiales bacterium]|nr:glycogen synthase GlgA [Clostridiales bacterium]
MKVLYAASEAVPFCRTGGLGDIAGSLPPALAASGIETAVVLPLYQTIREHFSSQMEFVVADHVMLSWRRAYCGLFKMVRNGITFYFIDNEQYFDREALYGHIDDGERFGFFSRAVVSMLMYMDFKPDIIHCNDWQTSLIPVYLRVEGEREPWLRSIRTVLNIHNIEYQGQFGPYTLGDIFGLYRTSVDDGTMIMNGSVNLLKGGIVCANAVITDSPTYANEIRLEYFAHGLESVVQRNSFKIKGILNGLDIVKYNPEIDKLLAVNYNLNSIEKKKKNKAHLQSVMGLKQKEDIPVIGIVSRLVGHKGFDLVCEAFGDIMKLGVQLAVIGQGETRYENFFRWASEQYPGSVGYKHGFSDDTAVAIYGGSDLYLMPSRSEPCGLSQMIAMRYGAIPVVRETGGLKDTVKPYEAMRDIGTGFVFNSYTPGDMFFMINQAVELYRHNPEAFLHMQKRDMAQDFSWDSSAAKYKEVYESIMH